MKKKMMVLTGLLMAVVITAYSVSGTYAKYTSTFTGTSSATVAKWAFTINGEKATGDFDFNLFDTILDTSEEGVNADGTDQDVAPEKIAPGTMGSFDVAMVNQSEVSARVTMTADVTYANTTVTLEDGTEKTYEIPLEFSLTGTQGSWKSDIDDVLSTVSKDLLLNGDNGTNISQTIYWRWAFNGTDSDAHKAASEVDTILGIMAANATTDASGKVLAPEVTVTLHLTAEQID